MRALIMLLLGLAIGAFATVTLLSGMRQETPYSRAVMTLTAKNFNALRAQVDAGACPAADIATRLNTLDAIGADIEPAFLPTGMDDALFLKHLADYRSKLTSARAAAPVDCDALKTVVTVVGNGCKACHADFKP